MDNANSLISPDKEKLIIAALGSERIKQNEKISYHTFSKLGGPARLFYIATNQKELLLALEVSEELRINFFILGAGSKILVSDKGVDALVIKNRTSNIKIASFKGKVGRAGVGIEEASLEVDSGVLLSKLQEYLNSQNFRKIDYYCSINSTIGGSIFIDPEIRKLTQSLKVWEGGEVISISVDDLVVNKHVVISVTIKVQAI